MPAPQAMPAAMSAPEVEPIASTRASAASMSVPSTRCRSSAPIDSRTRPVAVMGAAGENGTPEWAALRNALGAWRGAGPALVFGE